MKRVIAVLLSFLIATNALWTSFGCSGGSSVAVPGPDVSAQKGVVHYISDHLGNANLLTDPQGNVLREESRYPYGLDWRVDGDAALSDYVYTGKEYDEETGLVYFGGRYYSPEMGRWITPDPKFVEEPKSALEKPMSSNLYAYVRNNPMSYVDNDGLVENYAFFENPASDRNVDMAPRNVYEKMYIDTLFITATGGFAGPLLANDGSVDISIPDALPIIGGYQVSISESASLGIFNISTTGTTLLGVGSLGVSLDVTFKEPSFVTYGNISAGLGKNISVSLPLGINENGEFSRAVSLSCGPGIGPPITAGISNAGIEELSNIADEFSGW